MASAVKSGTSGGLGSQWGNLGYLKGWCVYVYMVIYIYYIRGDNAYVQSVLCDVLLLDVLAKLGPDGLVLQTW